MPELPDVEYLRRYLDATSLHVVIDALEVTEPRILQDTTADRLANVLEGAELSGTRRHGKWVFVELAGADPWWTLHFGMTGDLSYAKDGDSAPRHTRIRVRFEDGGRLSVVSQRLLGKVTLAARPERFVEAAGLGPDALAVDEDAFVEIFGSRRGRVKSSFMDQSILAGLGNIYADEVLFQARVHPERRFDTFDEDELRDLYGHMRRVLDMSVERAAEPERMPRTWLRRHREPGASCPRCGTELERIYVSQRPTWFCPGHQADGGG